MRKLRMVCCSGLTAREIPMRRMNFGKLYEAGCGTEKNQEKSENCYRAAFLGFLNLEKKSKDDTALVSYWLHVSAMG